MCEVMLIIKNDVGDFVSVIHFELYPHTGIQWIDFHLVGSHADISADRQQPERILCIVVFI